MIQTAQRASSGAAEWDQVVSDALLASGVEGTVVLGCEGGPVGVPWGLPMLMGALLRLLSPGARRGLRVCTYRLRDAGCVLELRGGRELTCFPEILTRLVQQVGAKAVFARQSEASVVLLSLLSQHPGA